MIGLSAAYAALLAPLASAAGRLAAGIGRNIVSNTVNNKIGSSITSVTNQTSIVSRAFIDSSVVGEPVLPNVMKSAHDWYSAQCISALHLSQMVDEKRTVQSMMQVLQTGQNTYRSSAVESFTDVSGQESFLGNYLGDASNLGLESSIANPGRRPDFDGLDKNAPVPPAFETAVQSINTYDKRIGPMGELFEIKIRNPRDPSQSVTVPLYVQMQPSIIDERVAPRFIDMNVAPSVWQRWTQMRAGELRFWKDFIAQRDLAKRGKSILKDPEAAKNFEEFLVSASKKDRYALNEVTSNSGMRKSANLSNSIVIFSEQTVLQARADSGIDLHNKDDRTRYFDNTYTMIIVIIDPLHQRVTVYFNGLDGSINAPYSSFKPNDTKFDPRDFMTTLQAFSTPNAGRLR